MLTVIGLLLALIAGASWFLPLGVMEFSFKNACLLEGMLGVNIFGSGYPIALSNLMAAFVMQVLLILMLFSLGVLTKTKVNIKLLLTIYDVPSLIMSLTSLFLAVSAFSTAAHGMGTLLFILLMGFSSLCFILDLIKSAYLYFENKQKNI